MNFIRGLFKRKKRKRIEVNSSEEINNIVSKYHLTNLDEKDMDSAREIVKNMCGCTLLHETIIEQNFLMIRMLGDIKRSDTDNIIHILQYYMEGLNVNGRA